MRVEFKMYKTCFIFLIGCTWAIGAFAQVPKDDGMKGATPLVLAKNYFDIGDYKGALPAYQKLLAEKPEDEFLNYRVGLCHLRQNINKSLSIPYLRKVVTMKKFDNEALYEAGLAYMFNEQIDSALLFFNKYKMIAVDPIKMVEVTRQIEFCGNAKKFMKEPLNVTLENMGTEVNSEGPDFNPMVPLDQSFMLYTTKREKGVMGNNLDFDGYKPPDIFMASVKNGEFTKGKSASALVNSEWVEELAGISAYGEHMFLMVDNVEASDDIWGTVYSGRSWPKPLPLGPSQNSEDVEQAASCSPDGQTLYFSRFNTITPGFGELDIYMAKRLPTGDWGIPTNLGPTVNTQYNESYPMISHDGKTLYFCSQGHRSIGGYDIFKSVWDDKMQRWERPENVGYPINTTSDNFVFSPTEDPRVGYTSQLRAGGYGDLDIYRVIFNAHPVRLSTVVLEMDVVTGPKKDILKVHEWKTADGQLKWFPASIEYQPTDRPEYTFVATKDIEVKDGEAYEFTIIGSVAGGEVGKYDEKTFPKGGAFTLVDIRSKKNKVPLKGVKPTVTSLKGKRDIKVEVSVKDAQGKEVGKYKPNYNKGRIVAVLVPGQLYEFTIQSKEFQEVKEKVYVMGLGDYKEVITRKITLLENGLEMPMK